jgi:phage shock protein A
MAKRLLGALLVPAADPRTIAAEDAPTAARGSDDLVGLDGLGRHQRLLAQVCAAYQATDAARQRLEERIAALRQRGQAGATVPLEHHLRQVQDQTRRLAQVEERLAAQIEALCARQEALIAQAQASETLEDVWPELDTIGLAAAEAEQATEQWEARLQAMDDLAATGVLPPLDRRSSA